MKKIVQILIFAFIGVTTMHRAQAQVYDPLAVQRINDLITNNGLQATPNAPTTWEFAIWNNKVPKQIIELQLNKKYGYMKGDASFAGLTTLQVLNCNYGYLTKIDVTNCIQLQALYCMQNWIKEIDLTNCTQIRQLVIENNQISKLILTHCKQLQKLYYYRNHLTELDLSGLDNLTDYYDEHQIPYLTLYKNEADEYTLPITLNNPTFENKAISYSNGILKSTNKNVSWTNFTVQTNNVHFEMKGEFKFTYSDDTGIIESDNEQIKVYPNPTTGELTVTSYKLQVTSVEVFDVNGSKQKVESRKQKAEGEIVLDISHLPAGIYFVKVFTDQGEVIKKIVKQ